MIDKYLKLQKIADNFINQNKISVNANDKYKIVEQIALYIDAVIFNIVSIFCLISVLNNSNKITEKTIEVGKQYVESKCNFNYTRLTKNMQGGRLSSATFLGLNEPMYDANNSTNDILNVNYEKGEVRPQIGGSKMSKFQKLVYSYIHNIISYHNMTVKKTVKNAIFKLVWFHIECFLSFIQSYHSVLTLSMINKIVKDHKILHPLK